MSYKYNPSANDMRVAFTVAYGETGDVMMMGAMFGHLQYKEPNYLENLYQETLDKVKADMEKAGQL